MKRLAKQCNQTTASNQDTTSYEMAPTDPRNSELFGVHEHGNDHGLAKGQDSEDEPGHNGEPMRGQILSRMRRQGHAHEAQDQSSSAVQGHLL